jgi:hypothetical protein
MEDITLATGARRGRRRASVHPAPGNKIAVAKYRRFMGEKDVESYEDLKSYAQAIKGDELFAQRMLKAAGQGSVPRMGLTEGDVASIVGEACGLSRDDLSGLGRHRPRSRARILAASRYFGGALVTHPRTTRSAAAATSSTAR